MENIIFFFTNEFHICIYLGFDYWVDQPKEEKFRVKSYADNFKVKRIYDDFQWNTLFAEFIRTVFI